MRKKIWLLNHYATNMYESRGGRHFWFAKKLLGKGYEPVIFCANTFYNNNNQIDLDGKIYIKKIQEKIPFIFIKTIPSIGNGLKRILNMGLFYWNLKKVAKLYIKNNEKPDIILASSVHPLTLIAGIQIGKKYKIPCICEIRDLWPEAIFWFNKSKEKTLLGKLLVLGEHWIYRNADALIFTKEGDTDYIKEKKWDKLQGGDIDLSKAYYINNGIDKKQYDTLKEQVYQDDDLENNKFKVIYAGAIRPINNVGMIIDTAKELEEQDVEFLIYGDGNEREKLEKRVQDENIKNVKFKGLVSKEKIPYILSKGSINLLNYSATQYNWARGNSSNKLFEYMASGKPIISNVKMGYSILNKYKCGIELDNPNSKELAKEILKIKNLSKEEYEKMGKNGIEGSKDFDFSILTEKLIRIIESFEDIL